jgi:hypothetical protein
MANSALHFLLYQQIWIIDCLIVFLSSIRSVRSFFQEDIMLFSTKVEVEIIIHSWYINLRLPLCLKLLEELTLIFTGLLNLSRSTFLIIRLILNGVLPWEDQLLLLALVDSLYPRFLPSVLVKIIFLAPQVVPHELSLQIP